MKAKTTLAFFICALSVLTAFAQPPDTLWTQTFGGNLRDKGYSVQQTGDGGYIIAGATNSYGAGAYDVYLIKTDGVGDEEWTQAFGGNDGDWGSSVQQTSDGGYIIAGETNSYGAGWWDVYLIKTDGDGNEVWTQTFGGTSSDAGYSVQQTTDGGFVIAGYTNSYGAGWWDVYLIKTDGGGNEVWSQTFGDNGSEIGRSVQQTSDGGYIIAGETNSYGAGAYDVYLIKTDGDGNEEWTRTLGGSDDDEAYSVQQTSDGGFVIVGYTNSYGAGWWDVYLIKTDDGGNEVWTQTFGGTGFDEGYSVQQTSDGGYIITGSTYSFGAAAYNVYLIKTDGGGNEEWIQNFGGSGSDFGYSVQQTSDGGFVIAGYTTSYGAGSSDVWLIRLDSETGVIELDLPQPSSYSLLPAYPNPFNPSTLIRFQIPTAGDVQIKVYDIQGNIVATITDGWQTPGSYQIPFNAASLSSGIYLARLTAGDFTQTRKLVLMK